MQYVTMWKTQEKEISTKHQYHPVFTIPVISLNYRNTTLLALTQAKSNPISDLKSLITKAVSVMKVHF